MLGVPHRPCVATGASRTGCAGCSMWTFKEDLSRLRKGAGARNMAVVRHFALNLVRSLGDKRSIKLRRKRAAWATGYLNQILTAREG